jgi:hypothetical protein
MKLTISGKMRFRHSIASIEWSVQGEQRRELMAVALNRFRLDYVILEGEKEVCRCLERRTRWFHILTGGPLEILVGSKVIGRILGVQRFEVANERVEIAAEDNFRDLSTKFVCRLANGYRSRGVLILDCIDGFDLELSAVGAFFNSHYEHGWYG